MRRRLALWELGGFLFTAALGTVLHFTYGWSGGNLLAVALAACAAVYAVEWLQGLWR